MRSIDRASLWILRGSFRDVSRGTPTPSLRPSLRATRASPLSLVDVRRLAHDAHQGREIKILIAARQADAGRHDCQIVLAHDRLVDFSMDRPRDVVKRVALVERAKTAATV